MRLYHGSNVVIESINLAMCRPYKDFGKGFYLTDIEEQAKQMAKRVSGIYGGSPVVNTFEIQDDFRKMSDIKIKDFGIQTTEEWSRISPQEVTEAAGRWSSHMRATPARAMGNQLAITLSLPPALRTATSSA